MKLIVVKVDSIFSGNWFTIIAEDNNGNKKEFLDSFNDENVAINVAEAMEHLLVVDDISGLSDHWV